MTAAHDKVYFPGLNALRFVAAFLVVVQHIELVKYHFGYANILDPLRERMVAGLGVTFFFVLSGFLITYLLLTEKNITGRTSVRNFYIRRI